MKKILLSFVLTCLSVSAFSQAYIIPPSNIFEDENVGFDQAVETLNDDIAVMVPYDSVEGSIGKKFSVGARM